MGEKEDKKAKKAAMKQEAENLGITYEELKQRKKNKTKREADSLETEEHKGEMNRIRSYSKDLDPNDEAAKRRRTRSMDAAEEEEAITKEEKSLSPDEWRKEHQIALRGHGDNSTMKSFADPYIEFKDAPFSDAILTTLTRAGFTRPSPIQGQAWPLAIGGNDLICVAKTGSGKTCGFLMPVFHRHESLAAKPVRGQVSRPILLVLAPTRELGVQILEEAQKFGRPLGIRSVCCYGGSPKYAQIQALQRGVECVIATPGRLNDLLESRKADLSTVKYLVLDEADRMLDMVSKNDVGFGTRNALLQQYTKHLSSVYRVLSRRSDLS
jgi:ATP-dependent RNA helicase DDX5/DBP2